MLVYDQTLTRTLVFLFEDRVSPLLPCWLFFVLIGDLCCQVDLSLFVGLKHVFGWEWEMSWLSRDGFSHLVGQGYSWNTLLFLCFGGCFGIFGGFDRLGGVVFVVKEATVRRIGRTNWVPLIHSGSFIDFSDLLLGLSIRLRLERNRNFGFLFEPFPEIAKLTFQPPAYRNIIERIEQLE